MCKFLKLIKNMTIENIKSIDFHELADARDLIIADNNCTVSDIENIIEKCSTQLNYLTIESSKIKDFPKNLNRLIHLTDLHLDLKKLSNLPTHSLPEGVTSLHIKCPNLKELSSESLNNLINLSYLTIEAPLSKMIDLSVLIG
jgi:hypothetical protein